MRMKTFLVVVVLTLNCAIAANEPAKDTDDESAEIAYFDLRPSFVSNLNGGPKYIRCNVQLMFKQPDMQSLIELHMPALRHEILMLLPEQDGQTLMQTDGKNSLRRTIRDALRRVLRDKTEQPIIEDVYFTAYYVR